MKELEIVGVIGLGYVGMPLAMAFAQKYDVIGFDAYEKRIQSLREGVDATGEFSAEELRATDRLTVSSDASLLEKCTFLIVAVPTPLDDAKNPDLTALRLASETVGKVLKPGAMVVYESTVYPGVTEEVCLPILEEMSGLKLGEFDLGYSPERVNPGDKEHTVCTIMKIVSGHSSESLARAERVYGSIVTAGIHSAASIKTAEAAKVIENVQRDLNISLMNELSKIFSLMDIDTRDVLDAAGTKWNFHKYHPGLVGGHCIGVDPYYLTHRALQLGYHPEVILAGRRINDSMGSYVADKVVHALIKSEKLPTQARVLVMGLTFKENVPDFRNSRAEDVVNCLMEYGIDVYVWEPLADPADIEERFGYKTMDFVQAENLDAVVLVNGHDAFGSVTLSALKDKLNKPVLVDVKKFFSKEEALELGFDYVTL